MDMTNEIFREVLFDSSFSAYWKLLGFILIWMLAASQLCVLFTLLLEFFRKKTLLSRKPTSSGGSPKTTDGCSDFQKLWKEVFPLLFYEDGIPRPRSEVKLWKIFHYIRRLKALNPSGEDELEKLECLMKNADYYQRRKILPFDWKLKLVIHLLVGLLAVCFFFFMHSPTLFQLVLYLAAAEGVALLCIAYFKLLGAILAVPESLNVEIVHPFFEKVWLRLISLPKGLFHIGGKSSQEMFKWLEKEFERSKRSVKVVDYEGRVIRVEDDTDRQLAAMIAVLIFIGLILGLLIYFLILWFYLICILFLYSIPIIMIYYFFRNYVFYGRFQKALPAAVILLAVCCTVAGGCFFYTSWQEKSAQMKKTGAEEKKKAAAANSSQSAGEVRMQTPENRSRAIISLADAFPPLYQIRLLNFYKPGGRDFGIVTVDYQVKIGPDDYKKYLERFRQELSGLGFTAMRINGGNTIQMIYNGSEGNGGIFHIGTGGIAILPLIRHYKNKFLLCRFDFLDKNGRVLLSRTVNFGAPVSFDGNNLNLYPPQNGQLDRTARMRFNFKGNSAVNAIADIRLTLNFAQSPAGSIGESRESIRK